MSRERILELIDEVKLVPCRGSGPTGWVYFIVCTETYRCKIGFTKGDPEKRRANLQTGSAGELAITLLHPGTPETERKLHDMFAASRLHGEWFEITDELRAYMTVALWAMTEATIKAGRKIPYWMSVGLEISLDHLNTMPESLIELIEADGPPA